MKRFLSPNLSEKYVPAIKQTTRPRICTGVWFYQLSLLPEGRGHLKKLIN